MAGKKASAAKAKTKNPSVDTSKLIQRPRIVQALHSEHIYMSNLLDALEEQTTVMVDGGDVDINLILDIVHYMKSFPDRFHHPREDIMYEVLARRENSIRALLLNLRGEHPKLEVLAEDVVDIIEDVRLLPTSMKKQRAKELCDEYTAMLRHHMDQEEAGVFPIAAEVLTQRDWDEIEELTARYESMPIDQEVKDKLASVRRKFRGSVEDAREDLLLIDFVSTTALMETAGALAKGLSEIGDALSQGVDASWSSYTGALKSLLPGEKPEKSDDSPWGDVWTTFKGGVSQVGNASRSMSEQSARPSLNSWRLIKRVVGSPETQNGESTNRGDS
ncbi:MAG: hemerythrin domain-containing protein [Pseudomonadales bacterium]